MIESAARLVKDADLSLFGVSHSEQPTRSRFPKAFNAKGLSLWSAILDSAAYTRFRNETPETQKLWVYCIQEYLKRCRAADLSPFVAGHDFEETARAFLTSSRRRLVSFFEKHGFFKHLKIVRVNRSVSFATGNFVIEVEADLRPIQDPTFDSWLQQLPEPAFSRHQDGVLRRSVHAHIDVHYRVSSKGAHLGYRIMCHTAMNMLTTERLTRPQMQKFVDNKLWRPIVKNQPIKGINKPF